LESVFTATDNIDDVLKQISQLERKVQNQLVTETRKAMRQTVRRYQSFFKKLAPKKTGKLRRSVKIRSRTRKGVTKISLYYNAPYGGYVNFSKKSPNYKKITNGYKSNKSKIEKDIQKSIVDTQRVFFKKNGIKAE